MSLSGYLQKSALNEHMIHRIIEQQSILLVAQGIPSPDSASVDTLELLGRVQALLVYQCIGLYDGNDRLRKLAEKHIPVLESWLVQLLEHTSQAACCGETIVSPPHEQLSSVNAVPTASHEDLLWYSWIVIESSRRTWLIAAGVQGIYKLLQQRTASCMGGMTFTSRRGFWEAPTAASWEKKCVEVYSGLVHLTEVQKMLTLVPRSEINEFAKLVLECTYGIAQTKMWGM